MKKIKIFEEFVINSELKASVEKCINKKEPLLIKTTPGSGVIAMLQQILTGKNYNIVNCSYINSTDIDFQRRSQGKSLGQDIIVFDSIERANPEVKKEIENLLLSDKLNSYIIVSSGTNINNQANQTFVHPFGGVKNVIIYKN